MGSATLLLRFVVFPLCWWGLAHVRFTTLCSCGLHSRALSFLCWWGPGTALRSSLLVGLRCVYDLRPCAFLICLLFAGGPLAFLVPFCVLPAVLVWRSFVALPLSPFPAPLRFLDLSLSASCLLFCCLLFAGGPSAFLSLSVSCFPCLALFCYFAAQPLPCAPVFSRSVSFCILLSILLSGVCWWALGLSCPLLVLLPSVAWLIRSCACCRSLVSAVPSLAVVARVRGAQAAPLPS